MSFKWMRLLLILFCISFINGCSMFGIGGKKHLEIVGKVIFPMGDPVPIAKISTQPPSQTKFSDSYGIFVIDEGLQPGNYTILATKEDEDGNIDRGSIIYALSYGSRDTVIVKVGELGIPWIPKDKSKESNHIRGEIEPPH